MLFASLAVGLVVLLVSFFGGSGTELETLADDKSPPSGLVAHLDAAGFDRAISEGIVLVDFWATWCPPCRIQGPILEELAVDLAAADIPASITKLDVDDHGSIASRFGVRSIPTLILFQEGEEVERFVGVQQKDALKDLIVSYL